MIIDNSTGLEGSHSILVVDDEEILRELFRTILERENFTCVTAKNGRDALEKMDKHAFDVVITDIIMPEMDGIELSQIINRNYGASVIVMTGFSGNYTYDEVIQAGAKDFIIKPVDTKEILIRLKRVLRERTLMEERDRAFRDLKSAYLDTIYRLVLATEYKDDDTGEHIIRMSKYSSLLAVELGLPDGEVEGIRYASIMHDIGKIGISDDILLKPARLTAEEFEIMKQHTIIGAKILENSSSPVLSLGCSIALTHHEQWNGSGYPQGLSGTDIPLAGRMVAVADVFDALTSERPYKKAFPVDRSLEIMKRGREKHFDPGLLDLFLGNIDQVLEIKDHPPADPEAELRDHLMNTAARGS